MANFFLVGPKKVKQQSSKTSKTSSKSRGKSKTTAKTNSKSKKVIEAPDPPVNHERQISDPEIYTQLPIREQQRQQPYLTRPSQTDIRQAYYHQYDKYQSSPLGAQYAAGPFVYPPPYQNQPLYAQYPQIQRPRTSNANLNVQGPYMQSNSQPWASTSSFAQRRPDPIWQPHSAPVMQTQFALSQQNLAVFEEQSPSMHHLNGAPLDAMQDRMSVIITTMDEDEDEDLEDSLDPMGWPTAPRAASGPSNNRLLKLATQSRGLLFTNYEKVWLYSNSQLPQTLPPFKVYVPTYPLLCVAARYSLSAYSKSRTARPSSVVSRTSTIRIPQSLRLGTKAMVLALADCRVSDTPTVVLAIRGSANFADWAVNFRPGPDSPANFLDDSGNLVHSGFLAVAKSMIAPIADQLRRFMALQRDRGVWKDVGQVLLTGHSAGGAVASLLYCHLLSQSESVKSPLKDLRGAFKRVHCVTFGAPPISLLPLNRPELTVSNMDPRLIGEAQKRWRKNLFFAVVNEGDPVARADRAYIRSLLSLYTTAVPPTVSGTKPTWAVPPSSFSNAGRIVVIRQKQKSRPVTKRRWLFGFGKVDHVDSTVAEEQDIEAVVATDEELRKVVYGDPVTHSMRLYRDRVETLAKKAVTVT